MVKKMALLTVLMLALSLPCALGEAVVGRNEGEAYFPSEKNWTYHFTYAYPRLSGEDYASAAVNDTYQMALDEMLQLVLPMFSHEESMIFDGKNEVIHDFTVTCNNGRFLSILQSRSQTMGEGKINLALEGLVFDMAGEYLGETLTLRGLVMVGDSSGQIGEAVSAVLYKEFVRLQGEGVCRADIDEEIFHLEFDPTRDFYADEAGNAVFFFPPVLLETLSFDVPTFTYTPQELEALL
ncbi:MAG: hypothetical protein E7324_05710 [Clostridiales bacterium]|nr:hypothetical protein [Clostridiales bacterium]